MRFPALTRGRLLRRYKRFLADVVLETGETVTVHVPNTGSMRSTSAAGSKVGLSRHDNPKRKYPFTLEIIEGDEGGAMVGVNTMRPNRVVEEAVSEGQIPELAGYTTIRREVPYGESSRIDLLLEDGPRRCFVEVKNVTFKEGPLALFPDAVTARGTKHLEELMRTVRQGDRAVIFFLVNRNDCDAMAPAEAVDPAYAETLVRAASQGVEILAYGTHVDFDGIAVSRKLDIAYPPIKG